MKAGFYNLSNIKYDDPRIVRCWGIFTKTVFDFHVSSPAFFYCRENGNLIRMIDVDGTTDWASTPPFMWGIPGFQPCRFRYGATIHDDIYREHCALESYDNGKTWQERVFMQFEADNLLEEMIRNDLVPGTKAEQYAYRIGVWLGGRFNW